ncbi:MAG: ATP-binding protein [DPANN group archaeon]|nr:ATP-binding protein [DPANN group archaeon]
MKAVITGGPNCGKTSLITAFAELGYQVVPEAAELAIKEMQAQGIWNPAKMDCIQDLQQRILDKQIELETKINHRKLPIFLDRNGGIEQLAYCGLYGLKVPDGISNYMADRQFSRVYLLERVPKWSVNGIRYENEQTAIAVHEALASAYEQHGYNVVRVPLFSQPQIADEKTAIKKAIETRVEFILKDLFNGGHNNAATALAEATA